MPKAYERKSPLEAILMYCNFILNFKEEFAQKYSEECQKWMESYNAYLAYMKKAEEKVEKLDFSLDKHSKNHVLRHS